MVRRDLEAAGIPYRDAGGLVFDFHSLRCELATLADQAGVSPRVVQRMMRHSKLEMTELAKETMEGHPCVKSKAVVTNKDGTKSESLVWQATDLKQFPLRIERTEGRMNVIMIFRDIDFSKPTPELFDPPTASTKYDSMQAMAQAILLKKIGGAGTDTAPGK